jgi:LexA DNA binding domain
MKPPSSTSRPSSISAPARRRAPACRAHAEARGPADVVRTSHQARARPTKRQAEYLAFLRAFTARWGIPPSFEEIGRHFGTTAPSVNSMVKMLEARGFLTRVPGQARTLRVLVPEEPSNAPTAARGLRVARDHDVSAAVRFASLVVERLVPALKGVSEEHRWRALDAVLAALDATCVTAGATAEQRQGAQAALRRVALIAQGMSPETAPGRRQPWWRKQGG